MSLFGCFLFTGCSFYPVPKVRETGQKAEYLGKVGDKQFHKKFKKRLGKLKIHDRLFSRNLINVAIQNI